MVLLSGSTKVQDVPLKDLIGISSTTIVAASIADPYLLLHLSSGNALLLYVDASHGELSPATEPVRDRLESMPVVERTLTMTACLSGRCALQVSSAWCPTLLLCLEGASASQHAPSTMTHLGC